MSKSEVLKGLTNSLGLSPLIVGEDDSQQAEEESDLPSIVDVLNEPSKEDLEAQDDFYEARVNTKDLLQKGKDALDGLLNLASASESPRAYEVAATLIKNLGDMNSGLLKLHDQRRQLVPPTPKEEPKQFVADNTGAFVGTTAELLALVRAGRKKLIEATEIHE